MWSKRTFIRKTNITYKSIKFFAFGNIKAWRCGGGDTYKPKYTSMCLIALNYFKKTPQRQFPLSFAHTYWNSVQHTQGLSRTVQTTLLDSSKYHMSSLAITCNPSNPPLATLFIIEYLKVQSDNHRMNFNLLF